MLAHPKTAIGKYKITILILCRNTVRTIIIFSTTINYHLKVNKRSEKKKPKTCKQTPGGLIYTRTTLDRCEKIPAVYYKKTRQARNKRCFIKMRWYKLKIFRKIHFFVKSMDNKYRS